MKKATKEMMNESDTLNENKKGEERKSIDKNNKEIIDEMITINKQER